MKQGFHIAGVALVAAALIGATVYDGAGGRIDNGTVLFADGKVVGIGTADLAKFAALN